MLSPTYHLRGDYHTRAYEHVKSLPRSRRLRPAGGLPYTLLRNLLRLLALRPVCGAPRFDRNLTAIGCLSLYLPVPLRELEPDESADLSLPVPHCPSLSVKENDYEQRRSQVRVLPGALQKYLQIRGFSSPFLFVAPEAHVPRRTLLGSSVMKRRSPFKLLRHVGLLYL